MKFQKAKVFEEDEDFKIGFTLLGLSKIEFLIIYILHWHNYATKR
jgi:hypothetical protein